MKYVLRIVIVLVMIVGIVFGVRYFINKKPANVEIQNNIESCYKMEQTAYLDKDDFLNAIGGYREKFNSKGFTSAFINMEGINDIITDYFGEVYLTNSKDKDSLNKIKNIEKELENILSEYQSKCNRIKEVVSKQTDINDASMENFSKGLTSTLKNFRYKYATYGQFVLEYVKKNSKNNMTDSDFENDLNTIKSLVENYEGDR